MYIINHGYSRNIEGQNNDLQKKPEQLKQSDKCGSQAQAFRQDLSTSDMVYLYYIEGYSYRKIAKKMGCSPSTVVNRLKTDNAQFELFMLKYACGYGQIIKERHIKKKIHTPDCTLCWDNYLWGVIAGKIELPKEERRAII